MLNYFPTKIAKGTAFCNRKNELKRLIYNVESGNPTLIISPRRYGKTSLSLYAFQQAKLPFVIVDLYKAFSEEDIEKFILNGIGALLGKIEKTHQKLITLAADFFSNLHVNVSIEKDGLRLDFSKRQQSPAENILKALERLSELAAKRKKRVVLYLDEFQSVGEVCNDHGIEAAIREVAQQADYLSFVFSGSDRHLIDQIFNDKKKPFYNLCDLITLERISETDYAKHLQKASKATWGKAISDDVFKKIIHYSERHAYYLNKLCSLIWQGEYPTGKMVDNCWQNLLLENKSVVERELSLFTLNQRKILVFVAQQAGVKEIFSKVTLSAMGLSNSSAARAIKLLLDKDYLYIDEESGEYRLLDPLMKAVLADY